MTVNQDMPPRLRGGVRAVRGVRSMPHPEDTAEGEEASEASVGRGNRRFPLRGLTPASPSCCDLVGSVEQVIGASTERLIEVEGIGKKTAHQIRDVVSAGHSESPTAPLPQDATRR